MSPIHVCIDRYLPIPHLMRAARMAVVENPKNDPGKKPGFNAMAPASTGQHPALRMAIETGKMWQRGRTLKVSFLNGDSAVQQKIQQHAIEWSTYGNISFQFVSDSDAEIRIRLADDNSSWSNIGTDALAIQDPDKETMHYGWLTPATDDDEYSRVVLHEFGHALGCIHEHQSPDAGIQWNKEKVYQYYADTQGWSRDEVDVNIFDHYSADTTNFTQFDPTSIMEYPIPKELTLDGFEVGWNKVLSQMDKDFIAKNYSQ